MDKILELARKAGMGGDAVGWLASNHAIQEFYTLARADLEAELQEQCRINGMGAERELKLMAENARLKDHNACLSAAMPADFKDWHENSRNEWPALAAWVITHLREQGADLEAENAKLRDKYDETANALHRKGANTRRLKVENAKLQKANKMLDTALCRAYPYGCYNGDVAYLWNAAHAALGGK